MGVLLHATTTRLEAATTGEPGCDTETHVHVQQQQLQVPAFCGADRHARRDAPLCNGQRAKRGGGAE